jgi:tripartite-type tricarboxylate transporter receptor subunit TctC
MQLKITTIVSATVLGLMASAASADDFPSRPIQLVVPYDAGGGVDYYARVFIEALKNELSEPVVIEYKPGAAGAIGSEYVAHADPDGYTLLVASTTTMAINPHLRSDLPYSVDDFVAVAKITETPMTLVVGKDMPIEDLTGFFAYAKEHDGELAYGASGVGNTNYIAGKLLEKIGGLELLPIPYNGTGEALTALRAGDVQLLVTGAQSIIDLDQSGDLKVVSMLSNKRLGVLPDVKTAAEEGFPQLDMPVWYGLVAPAGTPESVIKVLNEATQRALDDVDLNKRLDIVGALVEKTTPEQFDEIIKSSSERWGGYIEGLETQ